MIELSIILSPERSPIFLSFVFYLKGILGVEILKSVCL
jgi:hypothetical protein